MNSLISLGAINKITGEYVYPKIANKKDEYYCPECNKDLILCQGDIRVHHFRHKVATNPCHHYSSPTETQIHKDAKLLMKTLLDKKIPVSFVRNCCCCKNNEEFEIPETSETSNIELEHRFEYHGPKIADVAYIENGEILCIFEICNTHKTSGENRPEPWFEIDAETLIRIANDNCLSQIQIPCIRCEKCEDCVEREKQQLKTEDKCIIPNPFCFDTIIEQRSFTRFKKKLLVKHKRFDNNFDFKIDRHFASIVLLKWLKRPNCIFEFDEIFNSGPNNVATITSDCGYYRPDIIAYNKDNDRYYIDLMPKMYSQNFIRKCDESCIGVYYIDMYWILYIYQESPVYINHFKITDISEELIEFKRKEKERIEFEKKEKELIEFEKKEKERIEFENRSFF